MSRTWTPVPDVSGGQRFRFRFLQGIGFMLFLSTLLVSGCSPLKGFGSSQNKAREPATQASSPLAPLTNPPYESQALPPPTDANSTPVQPKGLTGLQPPRGVQIRELFAQEIRDPSQRMQRVENAVIDIREDLDVLMPAIVRLIAVESDIQNLIVQLESLLRTEPPQSDERTPADGSPAPASWTEDGSGTDGVPQQLVASAPAPVESPVDSPPPSPAESPPPRPAASPPGPVLAEGSIVLRTVRFGEHPDRTRIVLDVDKAVSFRHEIDNAEKILMIELPEAVWTGSSAPQPVRGSPLIASWSAQAMDPSAEGTKGTRVILQLMRGAQILSHSTLPPAPPSTAHRIVLDIAPVP